MNKIISASLYGEFMNPIEFSKRFNPINGIIYDSQLFCIECKSWSRVCKITRCYNG